MGNVILGRMGVSVSTASAIQLAPLLIPPNPSRYFRLGTLRRRKRPLSWQVSNFESQKGEVGVLFGIEDYVVERAVWEVRDGGADFLARFLAGMLDKQAVALIVTASLGQITSYLERAMDKGTSVEACRRADNVRSGHMSTSSNYQEPPRHNRSSRRNVRAIG